MYGSDTCTPCENNTYNLEEFDTSKWNEEEFITCIEIPTCPYGSIPIKKIKCECDRKNGYYGLDPYNCGPTQIKCDKGLIVNQEGTDCECDKENYPFTCGPIQLQCDKEMGLTLNKEGTYYECDRERGYYGEKGYCRICKGKGKYIEGLRCLYNYKCPPNSIKSNPDKYLDCECDRLNGYYGLDPYNCKKNDSIKCLIKSGFILSENGKFYVCDKNRNNYADSPHSCKKCEGYGSIINEYGKCICDNGFRGNPPKCRYTKRIRNRKLKFIYKFDRLLSKFKKELMEKIVKNVNKL
jgi:hypothetical protein